MKAYLTSIGEKTTKLCQEQLQRFGFEVVLLDGQEAWINKYKRFIEMANEDCIRIDADVIPNSNIAMIENDLNYAYNKMGQDMLMAQWKCYDFYRNNVGVCSPVYYSKEALDIIKADFNQLDFSRPEATAWRLRRINDRTYTGDLIVGMHGFFQDEQHLSRHLENKIERKQMSEYDFDLAIKLRELL